MSINALVIDNLHGLFTLRSSMQNVERAGDPLSLRSVPSYLAYIAWLERGGRMPWLPGYHCLRLLSGIKEPRSDCTECWNN